MTPREVYSWDNLMAPDTAQRLLRTDELGPIRGQYCQVVTAYLAVQDSHPYGTALLWYRDAQFTDSYDAAEVGRYSTADNAKEGHSHWLREIRAGRVLPTA